MNIRGFILRCISIMTICSLLPSCFLADFAPKNSKTKKSEGKRAEERPKDLTAKVLDTLQGARLARRLSLDLTGSLPSSVDVERLTKDKDQFTSLVDSYLNRQDTAKNLASIYTDIWQLNSSSLPDLENFAAEDDPDLPAMTPEFREQILQEPSLLARFTLEKNRPYSELFSFPFTIVDERTLPAWSLTSAGNLWHGEPYIVTQYNDNRPAAGLLTSNGFLAAFGRQGAEIPRQRTVNLLTSLSCLNLEHPQAHLFQNLTYAEMSGDLAALAVNKTPCQSCHNQFEDAAHAFAGLAQGENFNTWRHYSGPLQPTGTYAGQAFGSIPDLAKLIGKDPRTHRCHIQKMARLLYQRDLEKLDNTYLAAALDKFHNTGDNMKVAVRELLLNPEYTLAPIGNISDKNRQLRSSGIRLLSRRHWQAIMTQLLPGNHQLEYPPQLNPGHDDLSDNPGVPDSSYWTAVTQLAQRAAKLMVEIELSDHSNITTRQLFTKLPEGSGRTASEAVVKQQMQALWLNLTSAPLVEGTPMAQALMRLYSDLASDQQSDEDVRSAWRSILIALFTHPDFLTY